MAHVEEAPFKAQQLKSKSIRFLLLVIFFLNWTSSRSFFLITPKNQWKQHTCSFIMVFPWFSLGIFMKRSFFLAAKKEITAGDGLRG